MWKGRAIVAHVDFSFLKLQFGNTLKSCNAKYIKETRFSIEDNVFATLKKIQDFKNESILYAMNLIKFERKIESIKNMLTLNDQIDSGKIDS